MASTTDGRKLKSNNGQRSACYSDSKALIVAENLQEESTFVEALSTLKMWLENGECTEQTADNFYSLIQRACAQVNYLQQKKDNSTDEISKRRSELMQYIQNSCVLFDTIKEIFALAEEEKGQNPFTEAQRNYIKMSRATIEKYQKTFMDELAVGDNNTILKDKFTSSTSNLSGKGINKYSNIEDLQREKEKLQEDKRRICSQLAEIQREKNRLQSQLTASNEEYKQPHKGTDYTSSADNLSFGIQKEAHIISVISPFLYVHRDSGQTLTTILSHLQYLGFRVNEKEVEDILVSNPSIFEARLCSEGTSVEKRWIFCGYEC